MPGALGMGDVTTESRLLCCCQMCMGTGCWSAHQSKCLSLPAQTTENSLSMLVNGPKWFFHDSDLGQGFSQESDTKFGSRGMPGGSYELTRSRNTWFYVFLLEVTWTFINFFSVEGTATEGGKLRWLDLCSHWSAARTRWTSKQSEHSFAYSGMSSGNDFMPLCGKPCQAGFDHKITLAEKYLLESELNYLGLQLAYKE